VSRVRLPLPGLVSPFGQSQPCPPNQGLRFAQLPEFCFAQLGEGCSERTTPIKGCFKQSPLDGGIGRRELSE
jgi:hypothetical protein